MCTLAHHVHTAVAIKCTLDVVRSLVVAVSCLRVDYYALIDCLIASGIVHRVARFDNSIGRRGKLCYIFW